MQRVSPLYNYLTFMGPLLQASGQTKVQEKHPLPATQRGRSQQQALQMVLLLPEKNQQQLQVQKTWASQVGIVLMVNIVLEATSFLVGLSTNIPMYVWWHWCTVVTLQKGAPAY